MLHVSLLYAASSLCPDSCLFLSSLFEFFRRNAVSRLIILYYLNVLNGSVYNSISISVICLFVFVSFQFSLHFSPANN